ncbi:MAG: type II secretion system protein N [Planctomycetota bacterium]|jgi:general secretion pathway protein C
MKGVQVHIRKGLFLIKLVLVLTLAYVLVKTVAMPKQTPETFGPASAAAHERPRSANVAVKDTSPQDYSAIVDKNIFGRSSLPPDANQPLSSGSAGDSSEAVDQELGLALLGTVAGSPSTSRAIIKDLKTDVPHVCRTGDKVGSVTVESIEENRVVLLREGQRRTLSLGALPLEQPKVGDTNQASSTDSSRTADTTLSIESQPASATILAGVEAVLNKALIEPHSINGQIEGLKIAGLENVENAGRLGLQNGDVICAVNGQRLTSKQKAFQTFMKARSLPTVNIELLRDNELKTLSFSLR